jgi:hypothetical protein
MDTSSFRNIVARLLLREICNVAGHGCSDDEGARLALAEVVADGFGAVESTSQISVDDFFPGFDGGVQNTAVGRLAGVGDEDVDFAKVFDHVCDELLDVVPVADLTLTLQSASLSPSFLTLTLRPAPLMGREETYLAFVCLGLNAILLSQILRIVLTTLCTAGVGDSDIGAHLGAAASGLDPDTCGAGGTGYDNDFALEGEEVVEGVGLGDFDRHDGGCGGFCLGSDGIVSGQSTVCQLMFGGWYEVVVI